MNKTLIINLGPAGDVLRTTALLRELEGKNYWLSSVKSKDILNSKRLDKVYFIEDKLGLEKIRKKSFDLTISLNEERNALEILRSLKSKNHIGVFLDKNGKVDYTPESAYWFDMSLSSKFGKTKADELKMENTKSLPQILIEMIGKKWNAQEYDLGMPPRDIGTKIGLIDINTGLWPNKSWTGYKELSKKLEKEGYKVTFLKMRPTIEDHIKDINNCKIIVCGDTLGMHIGLALKKKVVALFNCTSPQEIYGYQRLEKIISPVYKKHFYKKEFSQEAVNSIGVNKVYSAVKKALKS